MHLKLVDDLTTNNNGISISLPESDIISAHNSDNKNNTRLASILGTWTGQTHLKTDIGAYELLAYFVIHFMPDPMRGYGCSLTDCSEEYNQVCQSSDSGDLKICGDIADNIVDWSDVTAFIYFGARIDVGFPFNKHRAEDTGGWVGPFNVIMAKKENDENKENNEIKNRKDPNATVVVDQYVSRYVKSPLTPYLQMPHNCSLLGEEDFDKVAGVKAVESTTKGQYDPNQNMDDKNYDPYKKYMKTCDNGDVQPLLPLFEFDFEENPVTKEENVQVKVNYKLMTMPNKDDYMYDIYPMVQRRFNKADLGFHISGPYCYGNDPKRGYTFDMNFDTRDPKAMLKMDHGCIEGLPCTPPAAELYNKASSNGGPDIKPNIVPDDGGTTIDVGSTIGFVLVIVLFASISLCMCCLNCRLRRKLKSVTGEDDNHDVVENNDDDNDDNRQFDYQGGIFESDQEPDIFENNDTNDSIAQSDPKEESEIENIKESNHGTDETGDQMLEGDIEIKPLIENSEGEIV